VVQATLWLIADAFVQLEACPIQGRRYAPTGSALIAAQEAAYEARELRVPRGGWMRSMPLRSEMLFLACLALAGCGLSDGPGSLFVDPGQYSAYHCKDLATQWTTLLKREKDLRALMGKASEGGGGVVIGTLAYRSDYESVLTEKKLLQRDAAEKNCQLVATYESDQSIH
jgi:hypothetical protein